jgi:hypothetical protein
MKIVGNEKEIVINSIYVGEVKGTKICKVSSNIRKLITEALKPSKKDQNKKAERGTDENEVNATCTNEIMFSLHFQ